MSSRYILDKYLNSAIKSYFHPSIDEFSKFEIEELFKLYINRKITFKSAYLLDSIHTHQEHLNKLDLATFFYTIVEDIDFKNQKFLEIKIAYSNYFLFNPVLLSIENSCELFVSENEIFSKSVYKRG